MERNIAFANFAHSRSVVALYPATVAISHFVLDILGKVIYETHVFDVISEESVNQSLHEYRVPATKQQKKFHVVYTRGRKAFHRLHVRKCFPTHCRTITAHQAPT